MFPAFLVNLFRRPWSFVWPIFSSQSTTCWASRSSWANMSRICWYTDANAAFLLVAASWTRPMRGAKHRDKQIDTLTLCNCRHIFLCKRITSGFVSYSCETREKCDYLQLALQVIHLKHNRLSPLNLPVQQTQLVSEVGLKDRYTTKLQHTELCHGPAHLLTAPSMEGVECYANKAFYFARSSTFWEEHICFSSNS